MTSTTFVTGTTIAKEWLNDVNGATYNGGAVYTPGGTGAVPTTVQTKLRELSVTPQDFGAVGNGSHDDTLALQEMFATGKPWYIPYTAGGYLFSQTLNINADGICDGTLTAATGFATLAINVQNPSFGVKRHIIGLKVTATDVRNSNSVGIRVADPSVVLDRCAASRFDYGIQVWSYSIMLLNCNAFLNKTNLSAYAPSSTSEINDLKVIGGNYDSATEYSCRIGDPRFATTVASAELMGTPVLFLGASFDGAVSTFDRIYGLTIQNCYWEGPSTGNAIELGGAGDNWMRNVEIAGCYFSTVKHAIYCNSAINGLKVRPNYYGGGMYSALYAARCEIGPVEYYSGVSSTGFLGAEVHTGFASGAALSSVTFGGVTISNDYLINGVQLAPSKTATNNWYPSGKGLDNYQHGSSSYGRYRNTAYSGIAGTMAGQLFTCTTKADSYKFNGGDRVTTSIGGATFVTSVNYDTGVITVDGSASGAATISHGGAAVFLDQRIQTGTWDVTLTPATSGTITVHPSFNAASYTRIGNLVTVQAQIQVQAVSSPVGASVALSLPFAVGAGTELSTRFGGVINVKSTAVTYLAAAGDTAITLNYSAASLAATDNLCFTFSYIAA